MRGLARFNVGSSDANYRYSGTQSGQQRFSKVQVLLDLYLL